MSGTIIYDSRRIKAFELLQELNKSIGKEQSFIDDLWQGLILNEELMKEFMYYLDHHALLDEVRCEGYGLTDLYFWRMSQYNLYQDLGKNPAECNKEAMVLEAFSAMLEMKKAPDKYIQKLSSDMGMDRY